MTTHTPHAWANGEIVSAALLNALENDLAAAASGATTYTASTPAAQWTIPHTYGRQPIVKLYDISGNEFLADVNATATTVIVTFALPTAGSAVLI